MKLDFRPMEAGDLDHIVAVEQRSYPFPWTYGIFVDSLAAGYRAWAGRENDKIICYGLMMMVLDEAHLLNITVAPERQGRGYGTAMLTRLLADARDQGGKFMFLEVRRSNENALGMYRRFGFVVIGERRGYYPAASGREDAIVMSCEIGKMPSDEEAA